MKIKHYCARGRAKVVPEFLKAEENFIEIAHECGISSKRLINVRKYFELELITYLIAERQLDLAEVKVEMEEPIIKTQRGESDLFKCAL